MDEDFLSRAVRERQERQRAQEQRAGRPAQPASSDAELYEVARSFLRRVSPASASVLLRQTRREQQVETRSGAFGRRRHTRTETVWDLTGVGRGWPLHPSRSIDLGYRGNEETPVRGRHALCLSDTGQYLYVVVDDAGRVIAEGAWSRYNGPDGKPLAAAPSEDNVFVRSKRASLLGRPTGVSLRGNIAATFGVEVRAVTGQVQLSPNSGWQDQYQTDIAATHARVLELIVSAMADTLDKQGAR